MDMVCKSIAIDSYQATTETITSNVNNLQAQLDEHKYELHKQAAQHCNYVESNEKHISDIEKKIEEASECIQKLEKTNKKNNICIKILCIGLLLAGIGLLALTCHVLNV